jgi:peptidyl-prolyl cis-trans isomerase A (cyclophilin A)
MSGNALATKGGRRLFVCALALALAPAACARESRKAPEGATQPVLVRIQTELGDIDVEVDTARAPVTAANFLKYVDAGHYDGGRFHRTVKLDNQPDKAVRIEVVQAGVNPVKKRAELPPIPLERTSETGLSHKDGTISMARAEPDSARSDFFLCIGDQPSLDYGGQRNPDGQGFAAFGRVVRGIDAVRKIQMAPAEGQELKPPISIVRAARQ